MSALLHKRGEWPGADVAEAEYRSVALNGGVRSACAEVARIPAAGAVPTCSRRRRRRSIGAEAVHTAVSLVDPGGLTAGGEAGVRAVEGGRAAGRNLLTRVSSAGASDLGNAGDVDGGGTAGRNLLTRAPSAGVSFPRPAQGLATSGAIGPARETRCRASWAPGAGGCRLPGQDAGGHSACARGRGLRLEPSP